MNKYLLSAVLLLAGYVLYRYQGADSSPSAVGPGFFDRASSWVQENIFDALTGKDAVKAGVESVLSSNPQLQYIQPSLVMAIIQTESNFNQGATGAAGEYGLMQLHPVTFTWLCSRFSVDRSTVNPYDIETNIFFGVGYLDLLYSMYGDWDAVIQAYNVGPGAYDQGKRSASYHDRVIAALASYS